MSGFTFPEPIQRMMLEMQLEANERERAAVLANPIKHKLTLHWPEDSGGPNTLHYTVKGKRGPEVSYGYTTSRNLAGYFLGFRETINRKTGRGKRDMWIASKRRKTVADKALARYRAHKARIGKAR